MKPLSLPALPLALIALAATAGCEGDITTAVDAGANPAEAASASDSGVDANPAPPADAQLSDAAGADPRLFEEIDGLVAVEAEHFASNDDNGTPRAWYLTDASVTPDVEPDPDPPHHDGASGGACLEGLPDTRVTDEDTLTSGVNFFGSGGDGPTLSYRIYFNTTGTYYGHARAYSTGAEDNGIHLGIDGSWPATGERWQWCAGKNNWTWSSNQRDSGGSACGEANTITIEVDTPGEHLITISMREDGFELDKFLLTTDSDYTVEGAGPAERLRYP